MFKSRPYVKEYKVEYRDGKDGKLQKRWIAGVNKADAIKKELNPWKKSHKSIRIVKVTLFNY